ncbi:MAG: metallophosphoesterase [Clostridia bacterium]|nr:metallophosphoesterase [Clostridia bacterium]
MSVANAIFSNLGVFLLSILMTCFVPYAGIEAPVIDTKKDDCLFTLEMISDTHIEQTELLRPELLKAGLRNMSRAKTNINALVVAGDITNYADEPSLAEHFEIIKEYSPCPTITVAGNHDIGHVGDRDVTNITREEALANFIRYSNEYYGTNHEHNYYSMEIDGYTFIVLGDEVINGGHWDAMDMSPEQIAFLDAELARTTAEGKPVFVCCHWPVDGTNGEQVIWPGSGVDLSINDIKSVMEKYPNVFYISGHMHSGIKCTYIGEKYGLSNVEQVNGVTYISLPTYGIINTFGLLQAGTGMQLEVYENEVIIRPRNFVTNQWFTNSAYTIELV